MATVICVVVILFRSCVRRGEAIRGQRSQFRSRIGGDKVGGLNLLPCYLGKIRFVVFDLLHWLLQGDKIYNLQSAPLLCQGHMTGGLNLFPCYLEKIRFAVFNLLHLLLQGDMIFSLLPCYVRKIRLGDKICGFTDVATPSFEEQ
ncbi:hypothetical protein J1N35_029430, partial [Gossypium stocksii]